MGSLAFPGPRYEIYSGHKARNTKQQKARCGSGRTMAEADDAAALQFTPTWIVAGVCSIIVLISLAAERGLHHLGKTLKKNNQNPLYEALLKVKEELMLLGFISLLLTVFQGMIQRTCIPPSWTNYMLPCKRPVDDQAAELGGTTKAHVIAAEILLGGIRPGGCLVRVQLGPRPSSARRREKFHCCPMRPYISCTFSYLFWLSHMFFSVL